jgi:hypothetical protein
MKRFKLGEEWLVGASDSDDSLKKERLGEQRLRREARRREETTRKMVVDGGLLAARSGDGGGGQKIEDERGWLRCLFASCRMGVT